MADDRWESTGTRYDFPRDCKRHCSRRIRASRSPCRGRDCDLPLHAADDHRGCAKGRERWICVRNQPAVGMDTHRMGSCYGNGAQDQPTSRLSTIATSSGNTAESLDAAGLVSGSRRAWVVHVVGRRSLGPPNPGEIRGPASNTPDQCVGSGIWTGPALRQRRYREGRSQQPAWS